MNTASRLVLLRQAISNIRPQVYKPGKGRSDMGGFLCLVLLAMFVAAPPLLLLSYGMPWFFPGLFAAPAHAAGWGPVIGWVFCFAGALFYAPGLMATGARFLAMVFPSTRRLCTRLCASFEQPLLFYHHTGNTPAYGFLPLVRSLIWQIPLALALWFLLPAAVVFSKIAAFWFLLTFLLLMVLAAAVSFRHALRTEETRIFQQLTAHEQLALLAQGFRPNAPPSDDVGSGKP